MAQYHQKAEALQEMIKEAGFNNKQLQVINELMHGCTMIRQGKVIDSFFVVCFPNAKINYETREGFNGKPYQKLIVVNSEIWTKK